MLRALFKTVIKAMFKSLFKRSAKRVYSDEGSVTTGPEAASVRGRPRLVDRYTALVRSFKTPIGRFTLKAEQRRLAQLFREFHGTRILHISASPSYLPREPSPFRHITHVVSCRAEDAVKASCAVKSQLDALPFDSEHFDIVIVQHALEFHERPHLVIKEAARVTKPCGHVLVLSFNPLSLSGLVAACWGRLRSDSIWNRRVLMVHRLKDWFKLLDLSHLKTEHRCHVLPINQTGLVALSTKLMAPLARLNFACSSVVILCARKDKLGTRFLEKRWGRMSLNKPLFAPAHAIAEHANSAHNKVNKVLPFTMSRVNK